jgi:FkbM family methyltransferase
MLSMINKLKMLQKIISTLKQHGIATTIGYSIEELKLICQGSLFSSYSQHGEDKILDKLLGNKGTGFYVDIGTADPVRFSNTYRFYKKGWRGVLIEPNPMRIEKLKAIRPNDEVMNVGASTESGEMTFYVFNPPNVSTFSTKGRDINIENNYLLEREVVVKVNPLSEIFAKTQKLHNGNIDFISVDTEGYDLVVLQSNDWTKYRPKFVIVECIKGDKRDGSKDEFVDLMKKQDYAEVYYNDLNLIFKDSK